MVKIKTNKTIRPKKSQDLEKPVLKRYDPLPLPTIKEEPVKEEPVLFSPRISVSKHKNIINNVALEYKNIVNTLEKTHEDIVTENKTKELYLKDKLRQLVNKLNEKKKVEELFNEFMKSAGVQQKDIENHIKERKKYFKT